MGIFGKKKKNAEDKSTQELIKENTLKQMSGEVEPEKKGFFAKLFKGLSKTRGAAIEGVFNGHEKIDDDFYDDLEDALILSDAGAKCAGECIDALRSRVKEDRLRSPMEAKDALVEIIASRLENKDDLETESSDKCVFLIVGVNGVGKTTSIGKLASFYKKQGRRVMMAAADTFRAAAAEQLTEWAHRAETPIVKHGEGADPAAVVYDACESYKARNYDILICDTAGRLHNKKNLMDELSKIRRVIEKSMPDVPVEVLLVLDATTGQNAVIQAKAFMESASLTGIILTKLDGTAKGGVALSVVDELALPIRFVGVGEGIDDMELFDAKDFATALLG